VIERALILNPQGPLTFENLGTKTKKPAELTEVNSIESYNLDQTIAQHISRVLEISKGRINGRDGAAELLGINPSTLRNRMKKLGINYGRKA
jgi:DNA-binding NtrC family response regulator